MSKLAPRNATIEIIQHGDNKSVVKKTYHAVYTVAQEQSAYLRMSSVYVECDDIRCARVLEADENSLFLEYIPGDSLYESAADGRFEPLMYWQQRLVGPFVLARQNEIAFDSDLSNYIVHSDSGKLVAIDPVCADCRMADYAAVVFLWGILKLALRTARFWRYPRIIGIARVFMANYLARCPVNEDELRQQLTSYIDVVIGWNKEIAPSDGVVMVLVRRVIAIPLYSAARMAIQLRIFRPARQFD